MPITAEERGLIDAVIATPDDDAPRLVYADWLAGRGDPRGEFILLQCQLAAAPDDERRRAIKIAENKLLKANQDAWLKPLFDALSPARADVHEFEFVRGFVEIAKVSLPAMPRLPALFELAPLIRMIRLVAGGDLAPLGDRLAKPRLNGALAAPEFARLRTLVLDLGAGGNELADEIAATPSLRGLRELRVHGSVWGESASWYREPIREVTFDDAGAATLARCAHLAGLEILDLDSNRMTSEALVALAAGPWRLRELVVSHNLIELGDLRRKKATCTLADVFAKPAFAGLEVLSLASTGMAAADVTALVGGPHLAKLRELDLEKSQIGPEGAKALCKAFALPALRRLRLERNSLCDAGAVAIAGCAKLANLTELEAGHNLMGKTGGLAFALSSHLAKLERLTLNEPRWKPEMKTAFAESPTLARTRVYLAGRLVGRAGVTAKTTEELVAAKRRPAKPAKKPAKSAAKKPARKPTKR